MGKVKILTTGELEKIEDVKKLREVYIVLAAYLMQVTEDSEAKDKTIKDLQSELKQAKEDFENANKIIEEQNQEIEKMDEDLGKETGKFINHKKKKIQVRLSPFTLKGKKYSIQDLKDNVKLTVMGSDKKEKEVGITDHLLDIKSPILEIEE